MTTRIGALTIAATLLGAALTGCSAEAAPDNALKADDAAYYADYVSNAAEYLHVDNPPTVKIVKWIKPEEGQTYLDPCVRDQGFTQMPDGSWYIPEGQKSAFALATFKCWAAYPTIPKYAAQWTDKQRGIQYDWTVDSVIPCLEKHGYSTVGVPSRQTFIDTYSTDPFYPFGQVSLELSNEERNQLERECPQIAPSDALFPDE
ncbi:MAG TPA: hypothetical protein VFU07_10330 [Candidatus Lumbricidophila sp.]|nr:hypothetical protein [Candidatus Lumbricidophila sp.]